MHKPAEPPANRTASTVDAQPVSVVTIVERQTLGWLAERRWRHVDEADNQHYDGCVELRCWLCCYTLRRISEQTHAAGREPSEPDPVADLYQITTYGSVPKPPALRLIPEDRT